MRTCPPSDTCRLFLVRHAATEANERRPYILQGSGLNGPLSATGREQAAAVARFLSDFEIARIYASPMRRAVETAHVIGEHHGLPVIPLEPLTECGVGRWEGLDWDTIKSRHADDYARFIADPVACPHPGGESYRDVLDRVRPALEEIMDRHLGENIIVVAHNLVNRIYLTDLLGIELRRARELRQINACINFLQRRHGETRLITLNSVFHLDSYVL